MLFYYIKNKTKKEQQFSGTYTTNKIVLLVNLKPPINCRQKYPKELALKHDL